MFKGLTITLALGLSLLPAVSADARPRGDKGSQDPNRMICKTDDATGSRLRVTKTCLTAAQWDRLEHEQRETVERVQAAKTSSGQ